MMTSTPKENAPETVTEMLTKFQVPTEEGTGRATMVAVQQTWWFLPNITQLLVINMMTIWC